MDDKSEELSRNAVERMQAEAKRWLDKQLAKADEAEREFGLTLDAREARKAADSIRSLARKGYDARIAEISMLYNEARAIWGIDDSSTREGVVFALTRQSL